MKKNLLLVFALTSTLGFSQQVLKRITDTPTHTIVEMFTLRNGSSLPNTIGNGFFYVGGSQSQGSVIVYNPNNGIVYSPNNSSPLSFPSILNMILGNGTFNFTTAHEQSQSDFTNSTSTLNLNFSYLNLSGNADALEDSNTLEDLLYSKFTLPKVLNDGNSLPNNLLAICSSRGGVDNNLGGDISEKRIGLMFNGTTWVSQVLDPNGNAFDVLQEVGVDGQLLNLFNFNIQKLISIYPNPTNNFITIQNKENSTENFEYKIVDLTGRIVKSGISKFNEQINIVSLEIGNYIIQIQTDNKEIISQKIIKN